MRWKHVRIAVFLGSLVLLLCVAALLGACTDEEHRAPAENTLRSLFPSQAPLILDGLPAELTETELTATELTATKRTATKRTAMKRAETERAETERVKTKRVKTERVKTERSTTGDGYFLPLREERGAASREGAFGLELPRSGGQPVRFVLPSGAVIEVRELGMYGDAEPSGAAVAYERAGGISFWTRSARGYEEWLLLEPGVARKGVIVAAWEISGAALSQEGDAIQLRDAEGAVLLTVTAPKAYAVSGREVSPRLSLGHGRIELSVDMLDLGSAAGEAVLVDPAWESTPPMLSARSEHAEALLPDGRVLVTGGLGANGLSKSAADIYTPSTDVWAAAAPMSVERSGHTATLLPSGKVMITGGWSNGPVLASVEVYDPLTNTWAAGVPMKKGRFHHTATLLLNGRVLVTGGFGSNASDPKTAEIYDPVTATWKLLPFMSTLRIWHTATRLLDGRVLVWGGPGQEMFPTQSVPYDLFDPITETWTATLLLEATRQRHTATLLPDGKVLIAGGEIDGMTLQNAQVFDPADNSRPYVTPPLSARSGHTATLLPGGQVLVAGGYKEANGQVVILPTIELFYSPLYRWSSGELMTVSRHSHTATLLPDTRVLVAGGKNALTLNSAEIFGHALGEPCANTEECPSGHCVDDVCCDTACDTGQCDACSVQAGASENGTCELLTGTPCEDGFLCTAGETCQAGVCELGSPVVCEPSSECHAAQCEPASGECSEMPKDDGAICSGGQCIGGECIETPDAGVGGAGGEGVGGAGGAGGEVNAGGAGGAVPPGYYDPIYVQGGCLCTMAVPRAPGTAAAWLAPALLGLWLLRARGARLARPARGARPARPERQLSHERLRERSRARSSLGRACSPTG